MKRSGLFLVVLLAASCGRNNGTPIQKPARPEVPATGKPPIFDSRLQLAESGNWKADLTWDREPSFSDEEFMEMTGTVRIVTSNNVVPVSIADAVFTADMPQHGHGTGNIIPDIKVSDISRGELRFSNLYFTMTGSWRIKVKAIVDGKIDTWTTYVEVK